MRLIFLFLYPFERFLMILKQLENNRFLRGLPNSVFIGRHTYGIEKKTIVFVKSNFLPALKVGNFCSFAKGVRLLLNVEHNLYLPSTFPFRSILFNKNVKVNQDAISKGPIEIGHDVWIGQNALILSGVKIGIGAVIGAGAVVSNNIPPYAIAVGVPAKVIKYRFSPEIVSRLLNSNWWNLTDEQLIKLSNDLYTNNIETFLDEVESIINVVKV